MSRSLFLPRRLLLALGACCVALLLAPLLSGGAADAADPGVSVVYVANGANFPDALAGGPAASLNGGPLLLVVRDAIPPSTRVELERLEPQSIVILGGTGVVSAAVEAELEGLTAGSVTRLAGGDRFATAVEISKALPSKVADSDRLDGLDADAFLPAGGQAVDAAALQGLGPDAFLPAGGQAVDAAALRGFGPDAFASSDEFGLSLHRLDDGEEVTLVDFGPLQVVARCVLNTAGSDAVEVIASSTVDGLWTDNVGPLLAGEEAILHQGPFATPGTPAFGNDIDDAFAIAEQDERIHWIGTEGESTALGVNVFGSDCVVATSLFTLAEPAG